MLLFYYVVTKYKGNKMAKKKEEEFELDDWTFDDDLSFDEFDVDPAEIKDDRNVVTKVAAGAVSGARDHLLDPQTIKGYLRKTLPKEYGSSFTLAEQLGTLGSNIYRDIDKEIKPVVQEAKRFGKRILPQIKTHLPDSLAGKLEEFLDERKRESGPTKEELQEASIQGTLADIFKAQAKVDEAREQQQAVERKTQETLEAYRHKETIQATASVAKNIARLAEYQDNVAVNWQRKTLELQIRQYYLQQESLDEFKKSSAIVQSNLEAIVKNTALPDYLKITKLEAAGENIRNRFINRTIDGVFRAKDGFIGKYAKQLRSNVLGKVKDFKDSALDSLDMIDQLAEQLYSVSEEGLDIAEIGGSMAGANIIQRLLARTYAPVRRKLASNSKLVNFGRRANINIRNLRELAVKASKEGYGEDIPIIGRLFSLLNETTQQVTGKGEQISNRGEYDRDGMAVFDNRTHRSINDVIPGYLARILRSSEYVERYTYASLNPKDRKQVDKLNKIDLLVFDWGKDTFITSTKHKQNLAKLLDRESETIEFTKENYKLIDKVQRTIREDADEGQEFIELTTKEKEEMLAYLNKQRLADEVIDQYSLQNEEFWGNIPESQVERYIQFWQSYFGEHKAVAGANKNMLARLRALGNNEGINLSRATSFSGEWHNIGKGLGNVINDIQARVHYGDAAALRELGYLDKDSNFDIVRYTKKQLKDYMDTGVLTDEYDAEFDALLNSNKVKPRVEIVTNIVTRTPEDPDKAWEDSEFRKQMIHLKRYYLAVYNHLISEYKLSDRIDEKYKYKPYKKPSDDDNYENSETERHANGGVVGGKYLADGGTAQEIIDKANKAIANKTKQQQIITDANKAIRGKTRGYRRILEGYTGDGTKWDVRGIVHAGEVVWSQMDIKRLGGLKNVELLRKFGLKALPRLKLPSKVNTNQTTNELTEQEKQTGLLAYLVSMFKSKKGELATGKEVTEKEKTKLVFEDSKGLVKDLLKEAKEKAKNVKISAKEQAKQLAAKSNIAQNILDLGFIGYTKEELSKLEIKDLMELQEFLKQQIKDYNEKKEAKTKETEAKENQPETAQQAAKKSKEWKEDRHEGDTLEDKMLDALVGIRSILRRGIPIWGFTTDNIADIPWYLKSFGAVVGDLAAIPFKIAGGAFKVGTWAAGKLAKGVGSILGGVGKAIGKGFSAANSFLNDAKGRILSTKDKLADNFDVFVKNEVAPRLTRFNLVNGNYYNSKGEVIKSWSELDPKGIFLRKEDGTMELVISGEELKNAFVINYETGKVWLMSKLDKVGKLLKETAKIPFRSAGFVGGLALDVASAAYQGIKSTIFKAEDVYVKDKVTEGPRLLAVVMRAGKYRSKDNPSKVIWNPGDIDGEVIDQDANIVLTIADLKAGLVNKFNKPIRVGLGKIFGKFADVAGWVGGAALSVGRGIKNAAKGLFGGVRNFFAYFFGDGGVIFANSNKIIDRLDKIYQVLDTRLGKVEGKAIAGDADGDGDRDGSVKDQKARKDKDKADKQAKADKAKAEREAKEKEWRSGRKAWQGLSLKEKILKILGMSPKEGGEEESSWLDKVKGYFTRDQEDAAGNSASDAGSIDAGESERRRDQADSNTEGREARRQNRQKTRAEKARQRNRIRRRKLARKLDRANQNRTRLQGPGVANRMGGMTSTAIKGTGTGLALSAASGLASAAGYEGVTDIFDYAQMGVTAWTMGSMATQALAGTTLGSTIMGAVTGKGAFLAGAGNTLMAAGGVLKGGLMAAGNLLLTTPVGWAALAAGALALGGYLAYKAYKNNKLGLIGTYRYAQYGFDPNENDHVAKVLDIEEFFVKNKLITKNGKTVSLNDSGDINLKDFFELFDTKLDNKEQCVKILTWYQQRFKPIYLTYLNAIERIKPGAGILAIDSTDFVIADRLQLLEEVRKPDGPYHHDISPFPDLPKLPANKAVVDAEYEKVKTELQKIAGEQGIDGSKVTAAAASVAAAGGFAAKEAKDTEQKSKTEAEQQRKEAYNNLNGITPEKAVADSKANLIAPTTVAAATIVASNVGEIPESSGLNEFEMARLKLYGATDLTHDKVVALMELERHVLGLLVARTGQEVAYNGDIDTLASDTASYFSINQSDANSYALYKNYLINRFLPVLVALVATGLKVSTETNIVKVLYGNLTAEQQISMLNKATSTTSKAGSIWLVSKGLWPNTLLNTDASSIQTNLNKLKDSLPKHEVDQATKTKEDKTKTTNLEPTAQEKARQLKQAQDEVNSKANEEKGWWSSFTDSVSNFFSKNSGSNTTINSGYLGASFNAADPLGTGDTTGNGEVANVTGDVEKLMVQVYQAFRKAGFSHNQSLALTAEVGRENDYRLGPLFGTHKDLNNKLVNIGFISWQGDRKTNLLNHLAKEGVLVNGQIPRTQAGLDGMARYLMWEMTSHSYEKTRAKKFLSMPDASPRELAQEAARNIIRFDIDGGGSLGKKGAAEAISKRDKYLNKIIQLKGGSKPTAQGGTVTSSTGGVVDPLSEPEVKKGRAAIMRANMSESQRKQALAAYDKAIATHRSRRANMGSMDAGATMSSGSANMYSAAKGDVGAPTNIGGTKTDISSLLTRAKEFVETGKKYVKVACLPGQIAGMNQQFMTLFYAAVGEGVKSGVLRRPLQINGAFRTRRDQEIMYNKYGPARAARPGTSRHEFGIALDVDNAGILSADKGPISAFFKTGIPQKWGFTRPILYRKNGSLWEPWHLENKFFTKSGVKSTASILEAGSKEQASFERKKETKASTETGINKDNLRKQTKGYASTAKQGNVANATPAVDTVTIKAEQAGQTDTSTTTTSTVTADYSPSPFTASGLSTIPGQDRLQQRYQASGKATVLDNLRELTDSKDLAAQQRRVQAMEQLNLDEVKAKGILDIAMRSLDEHKTANKTLKEILTAIKQSGNVVVNTPTPTPVKETTKESKVDPISNKTTPTSQPKKGMNKGIMDLSKTQFN